MGEVILVSSGKGGTGKTMFSVNLGAILAKYGYRVMLIDMDMGLRNMDLYLGMEDRVIYNLMDVLTGMCRINKAMIKVDGFETLYFMAASPRKDERDITQLHMRVLCDKLKGIFDFIIIDCPAGNGEMLDVSIAPADKAIIVTEPEIAAVRDADITERYIMENGIEDTRIVLNKVDVDLMNRGLLPDVSVVAEIFNGPLVGVIQNDDNIRISTNKGIPIVIKRGTYIEKNFKSIASRVISNNSR
ncbi:MAG: septum site-determining protein MinD [Firmicutes bacterium]|nr:septum site-determining protein MinD [Bacillota bacterium]